MTRFAFNGELLTNSKDPFRDFGLTVRLRGGNRNMLDGQLRYATKIGERVAFKISGGATTVNDFLAGNQSATLTLIEPGTVLIAQTLDAQVGYTLKPLHTTVQAGGTNTQRHKSATVRFNGPPSPQVMLTAASDQIPRMVLVVAFRVGDYEVGEDFCPRLWGHPGIRY